MKRGILFLINGILAIAIQAQVSVSPLPEKDGPYTSPLYEVSIRPLSGNQWTTVPVLRCDVNTRRVQQAAYAEFDMAEPVVVRIKRTDERPFASVDVRPTPRGITARHLDGQNVEITLQRPEFLSIEFDGDRHHNLHLLANAPLAERHTADEPQTINWEGVQSQDVFIRNPRLIYFGPGVHRPKDLPGGDIHIPSNCTVYLAPGAVVKARFIVDHAENVRIVGRGIMDHPLRGVEITYSRNVLVEGLTFLNPAHYTIFGGESENITIRGIKTFSARSWTDGIDLMSCRHVRISDCFLRTSDDCIALYNHRWWYWGNSEDIDVTRCTMWPDVAHPVNIGSHGDDLNPEGETLSNVRIHDCDILYNNIDGSGLLAINCGDRNSVVDVHFDSIRAEGIVRGRVFDLRVFCSAKYNRAPGRLIDNVSFNHIEIVAPDSCMLPSRIDDYDGKSIKRYHLEDIRVNGRKFSPKKDISFEQSGF